jgi:SAM-dependent methyltransferase
MKIFPALGKGLHYRNPLVYHFCDYMKRGVHYQQRYKIALEYLRGVFSVLDVCAGTGRFKRFLPQDCRYTALDASREFIARMERKGIVHIRRDLHRGMPRIPLRVDAVVMIISLCQFRGTSIDRLLEDFKQTGSRVIIVEEVSPRGDTLSFIRRMRNYLCAADFFVPFDLFTSDEFRDVLQRHQYHFIRHDERYCVGCYYP